MGAPACFTLTAQLASTARGIMTVLIVQALVLALQDLVLELVRLSSVPVQHARSAVLDRF